MMNKRTYSQRLLIVAGMVLCLLPRGAGVSANQADINQDNRIDESDMAIMRAEMGRVDCASTPCQADLSGDGKVDDNDLEILENAIGSDDGAAAHEEVPAEPFTMTPAEEGAQHFLNEQPGKEPSDDISGQQQQDQEVAQPVSTRFIDNKDGTVTDTQTGLMWTKNADLCGDDTLRFHEALGYIQEMNKGTYPNAGFSDWRLPTLAELRSLLDYTKLSRSGIALPQKHSFDNLQSLTYNRTSYLSNTEHALFFSLYCRLVGRNVESCFGHVWAVRGSQAESRME